MDRHTNTNTEIPGIDKEMLIGTCVLVFTLCKLTMFIHVLHVLTFLYQLETLWHPLLLSF